MKRSSLLLAAMAAGSMAAHADVTVNTTTSGKALINISGDGVNLIKGHRMRTDTVVGSRTVSLIVDIDNKQFVEIDDKKKTVTITPLASIADNLAKVGTGTLEATLTKTAQTKQVAGLPCTVHDISVKIPFSPTGNSGDGMDMVMALSGTVCLSTAAPGLADYQAYYRAAADSGFIFASPATTKSPAGAASAKAYAALTNKMASGGMALESQVHIGAEGSGPMAGIFSKLAAGDITTTVTKIEPGEVPADKFEIPAGYKVKTAK
ncbi:MAG TPA: hypothetical protein VFL16_06490 [Steroidobacteraceae bacterium]|jgi:hypothetical protein|nr:hypothetical protein [Steroidobacteraceae bacterium]